MINFDKLDEARKARGHSVRDACAALGISVSLWYAWRAGEVDHPLKVYADAADRYIEDQQRD